jgi:hypothetical protein
VSVSALAVFGLEFVVALTVGVSLLLLFACLLYLQVGLAVKVMISRGQLRRKAEGKMLERCAA